MTVSVEQRPDEHRFEIYDDAELVGFSDYADADGVRNFHHTVTLPQFRGRGYAAVLTEHALDDTRAEGLHVQPSCWFVREFIDAAGDRYKDLLHG